MKESAARMLFGVVLATLLAGLARADAFEESRPTRHFASSDPPPPPWPDQLRWPDADDTVNLFEMDDVNIWIAQANEGRAVAAMRAGNMLRLWQKRHGGCERARKMYEKARELGHRDGAASIGITFVTTDCPTRDPVAAIPWLRDGAEAGSYLAAHKLAQLLAEPGEPYHDPVGALAYALVAAREHDPPEPRDPIDVATLERALTPAQRAQAEAAADALHEKYRARTAGFADAPLEETVATRESGDWAIHAIAIDSLRECERNLIGNCRGVRRLAYAEIQNRSDEFQRCEISLDTPRTRGKPVTLTRESLVAPRASRRLRLGYISGTPARKAFAARCEPVTGLAAQASRAECAARLVGAPGLVPEYPRESRNREEQGRVILYVLLREAEGPPARVELVGSSGHAALDNAAIEAARERTFRRECAEGVGYLRFAVDFRINYD